MTGRCASLLHKGWRRYLGAGRDPEPVNSKTKQLLTKEIDRR